MNRGAMESALGARIVKVTPISGGCINHAAKLETAAGSFFAKWNDAPPPRLFSREAVCLDALRSANSSLIIPEVVAVSEDFLITELIEPGRRTPDFDERLGRGLAELHRKSAAAFGFDDDTYCGSTLQPNPWTKSWSELYREHRLGHQLRLLQKQRQIGASDAKTFEHFLSRLPELLGPSEPPALIHGDLWSGNLHVTSDGLPALIDPASYYAHREAELGMMTLFGGFSARVFDAYHEVYPLDPDWRERNGIYQLYHVVNHANLFGGGYLAQAMRIVRSYASR